MAGPILVVEDDEGIAAALVRLLGRLGGPVEATGSGLAALERLRGGGAALVVLDLGLPDLDGVEVCRRLRAEGYAGPVAVLTAEHEARRQEALAAGADEVLAKPFRVAELRARVGALLAVRSTPTPTRPGPGPDPDRGQTPTGARPRPGVVRDGTVVNPAPGRPSRP